jgi:hypothetical protein
MKEAISGAAVTGAAANEANRLASNKNMVSLFMRGTTGFSFIGLLHFHADLGRMKKGPGNQAF